MNVLTSEYFLLLLTAALGAALGRINIKGFSLGSTGGIFTGIVIGWAAIAILKKIPETSDLYDSAQSIVNGSLVSSNFQMLFLYLFIAAIGLLVGSKLKTILNRKGLKLVAVGIFIPIVSMALTWCCLMVGPTFMGSSFNGYQIAGLYSGAMTNSAALGTSMDVMNSMSGDVSDRYAALDDADKTQVLAMIGAEDTTPTDQLTGEQVGAFLGKAKANISAGFAISFPVGTIGIILAMTILAMLTKKNKPADQHHDDGTRNPSNPALQRPIFFDAVVFGIVVCVGIIIGSIEIPLGNSISFSLSAVGGILISALIFSNIPKIGPIDMRVHPKSLAFIREMALIFFMSVVGLANGYKVVSALSGSGVVLAIMALVIEVVAILLSIVLGRFVLKLNWGLLSGAICGGCTSAVGLGTALNTMDSDEPTLGYGAAQPFAILANVLLISMFHSLFFI
jgi:putative transport protein